MSSFSLYSLIYLLLFCLVIVGGSYITLWAAEELPKVKKYIHLLWHSLFFAATLFFLLDFFSVNTLPFFSLMVLIALILSLVSFHLSGAMVLIGLFSTILAMINFPFPSSALLLLCCIPAGALAVLQRKPTLFKTISFPVLFFLIGAILPWFAFLLQR